MSIGAPPPAGPKTTVQRWNPSTTSWNTFQGLYYTARSIQIDNASPMTVYVVFGSIQPVTDAVTNWDMLVPPWTSVVEPCSTDQITLYAAAAAKTNLSGARIRLFASEAPRPNWSWNIPAFGTARNVQAVGGAAVFYGSTYKQSIAALGILKYSTINVRPPNQTLGVMAWNLGTTDLYLMVSGDGTAGNLTPTSGYADPGSQNILIPAGGWLSLPLWLDALWDAWLTNASNSAAGAGQIACWGF